MTPEEIVAALNGYHDELGTILGRFWRTRNGIHIDSQDDYRLRPLVTEVADLLHDHVPDSGSHIRMLVKSYNDGVNNLSNSSSYSSVEQIRGSIGAVLTRIERNKDRFIASRVPINIGPTENKLLDSLDRIVLRFHAVAVQLRSRHEGRTTLDVNDEYDVQDLVHALLWLHFDDVRKEEWVPSYAGSASRTDFLLPQIDAVVEIKKTRARLNSKTIGEQLIIDIAKYKKHPQCRRLICFVYDPEGRIANPVGIENDLNTGDHGIEVKVSILPRPIG